jgi:hypothetical protein
MPTNDSHANGETSPAIVYDACASSAVKQVHGGNNNGASSSWSAPIDSRDTRAGYGKRQPEKKDQKVMDVATFFQASDGDATDEDDTNFLALPPTNAAKTKYPPQCRVQFCLYHNTKRESQTKTEPLLVSHVVHGVVQQVGIHLASIRREDRYQIKITNNLLRMPRDKDRNTVEHHFPQTIWLPEEQLLFAPRTPVWFTRNHETKKEAIILGSEHSPPSEEESVAGSDASVLYSVQILDDDHKIYHGVLGSQLAFRFSDTKPRSEVNQQGNKSGAEQVLGRPASSSAATARRGSVQEHGRGGKAYVLSTISGANISSDESSLDESNEDALETATSIAASKNKAGSRSALRLRIRMPRDSSSHSSAVEDSIMNEESAEPEAATRTEINNSSFTSTATAGSICADSASTPMPVGSDSGTCTEASASLVDPPAAAGSDCPLLADTIRYAASLPKQHESSPPRALVSNPVPPSITVEDGENISALGSHDGENNQPTTPVEAATDESSYYYRDGRKYLLNPSPTLFTTIDPVSYHRFRDARRELQEHLRCHYPQYDFSGCGGVWPVVHQRCLGWHIRGSCTETCFRRADHVPLSVQEAADLEYALGPVIGPQGPIFATTNNGNNSQKNAKSHKRVRFADEESIDSRPGKKHSSSVTLLCTFHKRGLGAKGQDTALFRIYGNATARDGVTSSSLDVILPSCFGLDFYGKVLIGADGCIATRLCLKFSCSFQLQDTELTTPGLSNGRAKGNHLARLKGPSLQKLFQYRLEIENLLVRAVQPKFRGYLLFLLGDFNGHRVVVNAIVQTTDPFLQDSSSTDDLTWVTVIKARCETMVQHRIIGYADLKKLEGSLLMKHPSCRIELVHRDSRHYPKVNSHIVICSKDYDDVYRCREDLFDWAGHQ